MSIVFKIFALMYLEYAFLKCNPKHLIMIAVQSSAHFERCRDFPVCVLENKINIIVQNEIEIHRDIKGIIFIYCNNQTGKKVHVI